MFLEVELDYLRPMIISASTAKKLDFGITYCLSIRQFFPCSHLFFFSYRIFSSTYVVRHLIILTKMTPRGTVSPAEFTKHVVYQICLGFSCALRGFILSWNNTCKSWQVIEKESSLKHLVSLQTYGKHNNDRFYRFLHVHCWFIFRSWLFFCHFV